MSKESGNGEACNEWMTALPCFKLRCSWIEYSYSSTPPAAVYFNITQATRSWKTHA